MQFPESYAYSDLKHYGVLYEKAKCNAEGKCQFEQSEYQSCNEALLAIPFDDRPYYSLVIVKQD